MDLGYEFTDGSSIYADAMNNFCESYFPMSNLENLLVTKLKWVPNLIYLFEMDHHSLCDMIYIKTQVFRLLRYYSPAPRNIARSDWATQNITHNMTSSKT